MSPAEIFRDFRRNFDNCFVLVQFPDSSEKNLFRIDAIDESEHPQLSMSSRKYGSLVLNVGSDYRMEFPSPITGVFQSGTQAWVVTRHFGAGYARGINTKNTQFAPALSSYVAAQKLKDFEPVIEDMFAQQFMPLSDAIKLLEHNREYRSCAINRSFSVCPSLFNATGYTLLHRFRAVAELDKDGRMVKTYSSVFDLAIKRLTNATR